MKDPNAPWTETRPECPDCGELIEDKRDHSEDCPEPLTRDQLVEYYDAKGAKRYDAIEQI